MLKDFYSDENFEQKAAAKMQVLMFSGSKSWICILASILPNPNEPINNKCKLLISLGYCLPDEGPAWDVDWVLFIFSGSSISFTS
jgi:hypothetical protein